MISSHRTGLRPVLVVVLALAGVGAGCAPMAMAPIATALPAPAPTTNTAAFVAIATSSNLFEIETSRLALERSSNPSVRRIANRMIRDHAAASRQLAVVLRRSRIAPPPMQMDPRHVAMLERLRGAPGPSFDAAYVSMQVRAHEEAIAVFTTYAEGGEDPRLRRFAVRTLPTLQAHARMVAALGGPGM